MNSSHKLFLHRAGTIDELMIEIPDSATGIEIIEIFRQKGHNIDGILVFIENDDEPVAPDHCLRDRHVKHHHHLHLHRCRKVEVVVHYNGRQKQRDFTPGTTVRRILHWAVGTDGFGLEGPDRENKELRLGAGDGQALLPDQHIGSFTNPNHCRVELFLTGIVEVNG